MRSSLAGASRLRRVRAQAWRLVVLWALSPLAMAASVPWTPSLSARHAIELLVDDGGLPLTVSQWPLPRDAVQQALDTLPAELPPALDEARSRVRTELHEQESGRATFTLRERHDALSGFGDDATPGSSLMLRSEELDGPHLAFQVGGRLDAVSDSGAHRATARLDESAVVADAFGWQAQAWAHRSWWGPGWQSALPLSNNAPALDGIGFQRGEVLPSTSPWLSWIGPWNFEFFVARTEGQPPQLSGSNSLVSGTRLTFKPFSHLELGLTRMEQFGGQGRSESIKAFLRALEGSRSNVKSPSDFYQDSGNGLAGYDVRLRCPDAVRCAFYGQFMGEDDRKHLPYRFLNLLGTEWWSADGMDRVYVEAAEIGCRISWKGEPITGCAYRNWFYPGGFTASNRWLGASVGSDSRLLTVGWIDTDWDSAVRLDFGRLGSRIGAFEPFDAESSSSGRLWALSVRRTWHFGATRLTPEFDWNRVSTIDGVRVEPRLGIELSTPLDSFGLPSASRFAANLSGGQTSNRLLTAAALIGGAAVFDRAADSWARTHQNEPSSLIVRDGGAALPYVGFGLAGAAWLVQRGSPDGDVALASVEAGLSSVALAEVIKQAVDRSRPNDNRGATDFGHDRRSESSFPSIHTALAWSVVTPVAQHYDAPWLYGVAAMVNLGRVADRQHWLSDTVAGAVLGYVVGDWFGKRASDGTLPGGSVMLVPHGVVVSTTFR
jgi:membrane-associated phospholipid phosphatase